mmetsp:Transcript_59337/g.158903  ORF Transcript_59337/g.158903 Transcript_59337/m.158903 type:complete len:265 (-) Transcript_59337:66-860(-)
MITRREIAILALLAKYRHQNVCQAIGLYNEPQLMVFLELCACTLAPVVRQDLLNLGQKWSILTQICSAVCHLHSISVVHMDLKSDNVLVVDQVAAGQLPWIKIADVGMGFWRSQYLTVDAGRPGADGDARFPWRAPEASAGVVAPPVDLYAYAGLVVEVARGSRLTSQDVRRHQGIGRQRNPAHDDTVKRRPGEDVVGCVPYPPGGDEVPALAWLVASMLADAPERRPRASVVAGQLAADSAGVLDQYRRWLGQEEAKIDGSLA